MARWTPFPIEIDALQDGFRYYTVSSANNVPSLCIEDIQTLQRAQAATSHRATRLRDARRAQRDTATRMVNAHAKSEQLVILLTNFVFIIIISFSCFGLL